MMSCGSRSWAAILAAIVCLGGASQVGAQCADDLARKVFEAGHAYYEAGDYEEALRSFLRSYSLCPKAEQQKNIGATHERLGNLAAAIEAYELYLRTAPPDAEDRDAIQVRITNIQKRVAPSAPPPATSSQRPPAPPPPEPPPAPAAPPSYTPAVLVLGLSGLVAVGSLITGLVARSRYNEAERTCGTSCPDSEVKPIKQMQITSTVLTGAAIAGAGVGAYLWWSASSSSKTGLRGVGAQLGATQAQLGARWAF